MMLNFVESIGFSGVRVIEVIKQASIDALPGERSIDSVRVCGPASDVYQRGPNQKTSSRDSAIKA